MIRCLWRFVLFDVTGIDPLLFLEFQGRAEIVVKQAPFVAIEVIDNRNEIRIIETVIAEQLPDMGLVLLLHEGIVILTVGS